MTTAQVVETSVIVNNNSPIQDYVHPDDQTQPTFEMTPGFKPFTVEQIFIYMQVPHFGHFDQSCQSYTQNPLAFWENPLPIAIHKLLFPQFHRRTLTKPFWAGCIKKKKKMIKNERQRKT